MSTRRTNYDNNNSRHSRTVSYVDGNTVRRAQEIPAARPSQTHPAGNPKGQPQQKAKSLEEIRREHDRKVAARRNMERAMALNRGYVAFLTFATVICLAACICFINLQSDISSRMSDIAATETAVSNAKEANDILESRLETEMTLDQVKERAADLGLVYPSTAQIEYFKVESDDYMNQYADVASR